MWIRVEETPNGDGIFTMPGPDPGVACRRVRHVAVIDLRGPFVQERTSHLLHDRIRESLEEGARKFAINLSEVPCADSYTLGSLARAYNLIRQAGGADQVLWRFGAAHPYP